MVGMVAVERGLGSGVSSVSALSAGGDSAPEASEKRSTSKGLRGVVKDGLRKGVAVLEGVAEKKADCEEVVGGLEGDSKPPGGERDVSMSGWGVRVHGCIASDGGGSLRFSPCCFWVNW